MRKCMCASVLRQDEWSGGLVLPVHVMFGWTVSIAGTEEITSGRQGTGRCRLGRELDGYRGTGRIGREAITGSTGAGAKKQAAHTACFGPGLLYLRFVRLPGFGSGSNGEHVFISLQELELRDVRFDVKVPAGEIDFYGEIRHSFPLEAEGEAHLLNRSVGEIRVEGDLSVVVDAACDRCLEAIQVPIEHHFDLIYMPADEAAAVDEQETGQAGIEVGYYEGGRLDVEEMLREVALLALPMRLVCSEACKGICPMCGQNRNQSDCACAPRVPDERWSQLKSLRAEVGPHS
jgi:uncharacterized protein